MSQGQLRGKIALVTGGRGGIGRGICERFAKEGATVIAADIAQGEGVLPESVHYEALDVTNEDTVHALMAAVGEKYGQLDILVNAAAIEIEKTIEETSLQDWNRIFAINVTGMFLVCKHAVPLMRKAGGGSIINFGSYDGFIADPSLAAYCATKGAVHALTKAMACDYGPENIRVNAVCPGFIDTPMLQSFFGSSGDIDTLKEEVRRIHPMRRYGTPADIASLVNWLAGDESVYASGQLWILDGGLTAQVQQMRL
ncbi:SDR family NAD(P)-dependent oxidoreductase [Marinobacterium rhizophilum]|uniref:Glucose 1-dehydrogenase n=1 Tax=Marinobacterium rhizophilum TaxID=420402 RepID=A0ABY5HL48_9GAMM|nr:SDR family oxidoreductase [Marinobacterium rhizophilum]UTW13125.1 glucose 1-dehydrogenase [Marinobacterium rhizophilum]